MENIKKKNDGGPAFPWCNPNPGVATGGDGMTLRDYFAAMAMAGDWASQFEQDYFSNEVTYPILKRRAKTYYRMADAMIKVREKI